MHLNAPNAKLVLGRADIITAKVTVGGDVMDWQKCMNQAVEYI